MSRRSSCIDIVQLSLQWRERDSVQEKRPRTRGECQGVERPCPWVGCRYHLYYSTTADCSTWMTPAGRCRWDEVPDRLAAETGHTCALDVADEGEHVLEAIAERLGMVRERARQIERDALDHLRGTVVL